MILSKDIEKTETLPCDYVDFQPMRLDKFLHEKFPEYSRTYFHDLIKEGFVLVNSKIIKKSSHPLKQSDVITINFPKFKEFDASPKEVDFEIIDNQKDFIIINKPAGLMVHHAKSAKQDETNLVNGLLYKFKELEKFEDKIRPGIVHRLDKSTSGLMIVAKNITAQIKLSQLFKEHKIHKTYLAVVNEHPEKEGKIDFDIGRHPHKRHLMSHVTYEGRTALTYYKVMQYYKDCSLVEVKIVTGRTHQIRVHLAAIGHGLIGDEVYGFKSKFINRPALHSWKLSFEYNGKQFDFCAQPPEDFEKLLKMVK